MGKKLQLETSHPMLMCCFLLANFCQTSPVLCISKIWKPGFSHKNFFAAQAISIIEKQHQHGNFAKLPKKDVLTKISCERMLGLVTGDHSLNLIPRHPTDSERKIWSDERNHAKPVSLISQWFKKDESSFAKKAPSNKMSFQKTWNTKWSKCLQAWAFNLPSTKKVISVFSPPFFCWFLKISICSTQKTPLGWVSTRLFEDALPCRPTCQQLLAAWDSPGHRTFGVWRVGRFSFNVLKPRPKSVGLNVCAAHKNGGWLFFEHQWSFILGMLSDGES